MGPSHWDTQRGDRWGGQGSAGVGLHQAYGCPTSVLTIRTPIHPGTLPPCSGPRAQHSWMPHLLPESPCPLPGFFMLAEVPPSNPKPGSPHAYLSCSSGAIFHFAAHPLGWVPLSLGPCSGFHSLPCRHPSRASPSPLGENASPSALWWGPEELSYQESGLSLTWAWTPAPPQCLEGRRQTAGVRSPPTARAEASPPCCKTPRRVTEARRATSSFMVAVALSGQAGL